MTEYDDPDEARLAPLGQAAGDPDPEDEPDFATEHEESAVDEDIITGADVDREPESPRGWSGLQR